MQLNGITLINTLSLKKCDFLAVCCSVLAQDWILPLEKCAEPVNV